jgi:HEXXH motif-containing protein
MPDALMWTDGGLVTRQAHDEYVRVVSDALGGVLSGIVRQDAALRDRLTTSLDAASHDSLLRVLLAPETTNRLLWRRPETLVSTGSFLIDTLAAETVRAGGAMAVERTTWTALGDAVVSPTGHVVATPPIDGVLPVDMDSPTVTAVHPGGGDDDSVWTPLRQQERQDILKRLSLAYRGIAAANPMVAEFVQRSAKVVVLQRSDTRVFAAYSNGRYIGRITIGNPQLVDEVRIAESLVHEAIHGLLYMQIQRFPWGIEGPGATDAWKATSPWSGRKLPLATYLHACFVWYGLLHFWLDALRTGAFDRAQVKARLARAASGFLRGPIFQNAEEAGVAQIAEDIRSAIHEMQRRVVESVAPTPPAVGSAKVA